jgi:hypothetical protein
MAEFPTALEQAKSLAKTLWEAGKSASDGLPIFVPEGVGLGRLTICAGCEEFEVETSRCQKCGCHMKGKARMAVAKCPLGKWQSYDPKP